LNLSRTDDGAIFLRGKGDKVGEYDQWAISNAMQNVVSQLNRIGLSVQGEKTVSMLFNAKRSESLKIKVDGKLIRNVKSNRFLGITLQSNWKWTEELNAIKQRGAKTNAILSKVCRRECGIQPHLALRLYSGLFISKVDYVLPYMSGLSKAQFDQIDAQMALGARLALGLPKKTSTQAVLAEAGLPPAHLRREWKMLEHVVRLKMIDHSIIQSVKKSRLRTDIGHILTSYEHLLGDGPENSLPGSDVSGMGNVVFRASLPSVEDPRTKKENDCGRKYHS